MLRRWLFGYTYFLGSINYGIGASILLYESWINHPSNLSDPYNQVRHSADSSFPNSTHMHDAHAQARTTPRHGRRSMLCALCRPRRRSALQRSRSHGSGAS